MQRKSRVIAQMFSLTVPTDGGKTLSSMTFALDHLGKYNLNRIFYVTPYMGIIEQNADISVRFLEIKMCLNTIATMIQKIKKKFF